MDNALTGPPIASFSTDNSGGEARNLSQNCTAQLPPTIQLIRYPCVVLGVLVSLLFSSGCKQHRGLSAVFGAKGLESLQYEGQDYLAYGDFRVNRVEMVSPSGQKVAANLTAKLSFDSAHWRAQRTYSWGAITVTYTLAEQSRLQVVMVTENRSANTIVGVGYEVLGLRFPAKPVEYDGVTPILGFNMGSPTLLHMRQNDVALVVTNDDVRKPLVVGLPWATDRPKSTVFPVQITTDRDSMYPDSVPRVDRPIKPGARDTYQVSFCFGAATTPDEVIASHVFDRFREAYPQRLEWKDRRPIGQLMLAQSGTAWPKNPRGWLLNQSIDVTTPAGVAAFEQRILEYADHSVSYLQNLNAQGMITWDLEGEQYAQPTTYIGDPRLVQKLAPEIAGVADRYFQRFRDAGFRVGVCIRPQTLVFPARGAPRQEMPPDVAQTLIDKITYAKQRWGATLFYIDSNGDPGAPLAVDVLVRVAAAVPGVLLIPEHKNLAYYSITAPYAELRSGVAATPPEVLGVYQGAFSVINVTDGPIEEKYGKLQAAVERGDAMLARSWFADPAIDRVRNLYSYVR